MSRSSDELDDLLREALAEADVDSVDGQEGESMAELLTAVFRGRHRRMAIGGAVANLALFAVAIFCGVQFLQTADVRQALLWGAGMFLSFGTVIAIKIWYWLEMNRLALTRELKRVELRVAGIARRLGEGEGD